MGERGSTKRISFIALLYWSPLATCAAAVAVVGVLYLALLLDALT